MARLGQIIKKLNIGIGTAEEFLEKKGMPLAQKGPSVKLSEAQEELLLTEFSSDKNLKEKADKLIKKRLEKDMPATVEIGEDENKNKKDKVEDKKESPKEQPKKEKEKVKEKGTKEKNVEVESKKETDDKVNEKAREEEIEKVKNIKKEKTPEASDVIIDKADVSDKKNKESSRVKAKSIKKEKEEDKEKEEPKPFSLPKDNKKKEENNSEKLSQESVVDKDIVKDEAKKPLQDKKETKTKDIKPEISSDEIDNNNKEEDIYKVTNVKLDSPKVLGSIDLSLIGKDSRPKPKTREEKINESRKKRREEDKRKRAEDRKKKLEKRQKEAEVSSDDRQNQNKKKNNDEKDFIQTRVPILKGPKIVDKVIIEDEKDTDDRHKGKDKSTDRRGRNKKKRDRIKTERIDIADGKRGGKAAAYKKDKRSKRREVDFEDINQNIKDTLAIARGGRKFNKKAVDYRKEKRESIRQEMERRAELENAQSKVLKLTEFVTTNELATMMNVPVNEVIKVYMNLGMFVGINQRLDAESINIVVEEFGFEAEFIDADEIKTINEEEKDNPEDLVSRPPIVTVMGHVDHGKTSLLDYIRNTNVIAGEAGGITQHIGAYNVSLDDGRHITFLDTPGHEAFTAMRARGAKVTDIAIIIVAADDDVMPQTIEAINHASSANVPIVFAINKIDKEGADPEKIKGTLANMNYIVEDWGGKYQSQEISAKKGTGVKELLDKVLLESELLDLKANPDRKATGSVIEVRKDKGRGNVVTMLVENGSLKQGDIILAGYAFGRVRAMFNERNQPIKEAKPSEPVQILGMKGEVQAGDNFNVMETEQAARDIISKRDQLKREQRLRTERHLTLDEIGRRIALGNFQELNLIVKGDMDGSIEALSDSLIELSTPEIQVNVIHKGVGQITEGDVNLAISSDSIIVGFQVRPTSSAKHLAEEEEVDIRLYSIIYQAIDEVKAAMEGMLIPEEAEKVVASLEVRDTFHISKIGVIAGCIVKEGTIKKGNKVRVIHDGIVVHTGDIASLKHEKDDVKEVKQGYECGVNVANFNDIVAGDIIESFEVIEIKKTLS